MPSAASNDPPKTPRLTDSPWYWAYLFGMAALAGLLLIGPKFAQRQEKLESRQTGREQAWKQRVGGAAGAAPATENNDRLASSGSGNRVSIWPLAGLLVLAMAGAWMLLLQHRRAVAVALGKATVPQPVGDTHDLAD